MTSKKSSEENKLPKAVIICGPTGSGKSALAMRLAEKYGGEIIGADSRQIYRRLDIGTAKPSLQDRQRIMHHMIDIADVDEDFTAKRYAESASQVIAGLALSGKVPFIVGGTGLYLSALSRGLFEGPARNLSFRAQMEMHSYRLGLSSLHKMLAEIDPESARTISPADRVRIIRALEVFNTTGHTISALKRSGTYASPIAEFLWIGPNLERTVLYDRINIRVDKMLQLGLIDEVKSLVKDGCGNQLRRKKIVGYYEILYALDGEVMMKDAINLMKQHTRNYAKRQLTWFRNKAPVVWLNQENMEVQVWRLLDDYLKKA